MFALRGRIKTAIQTENALVSVAMAVARSQFGNPWKLNHGMRELNARKITSNESNHYTIYNTNTFAPFVFFSPFFVFSPTF